MSDSKISNNIARKRRDRRMMAFALTLILVIGLGLIFQWLPDGFSGNQEGTIQNQQPMGLFDVEQHQKTQQISMNFREAVRLLHLKKYTDALPAWRRVIEQAPAMPEAQVNLGFTLLGLGQNSEAESAFQAALSLHTNQDNAYYGLALAQSEQGRFAEAILNMQAYLKLAGEKQRHASQAQALISQWQQAMLRE